MFFGPLAMFPQPLEGACQRSNQQAFRGRINLISDSLRDEIRSLDDGMHPWLISWDPETNEAAYCRPVADEVRLTSSPFSPCLVQQSIVALCSCWHTKGADTVLADHRMIAQSSKVDSFTSRLHPICIRIPARSLACCSILDRCQVALQSTRCPSVSPTLPKAAILMSKAQRYYKVQ